jgi:hypothetical protein
VDIYSIRKRDLLFASIGLMFLLSLKFGTDLIDYALVLLLLFACSKAVIELALRFRGERICYTAVIKPMIIATNVLCASIYAFMYCDLRLKNLPNFGDDQSTFLNVIGRVGKNVDNAQFSEGGIGMYAYFSFVKTVSAPFISSEKNQAIYALHFSWMFGLVFLFVAGSIAALSLIDINRKSLMHLVTSLVFVDAVLLSAFQQIVDFGYLSLLLALICLILGVSFLSDLNGFFGSGFRSPLLYFWLALLTWWPLYVFLLVLTPAFVLESIRKKNFRISVPRVVNCLLGLLVLAINLYYSILQGKSLEFLASTAAISGPFTLDTPVIEIALLISVVVVYVDFHQGSWRPRTTLFALVAIFLFIYIFDGYSGNHGMSKLVTAVAVSSSIAGIAWLLSVAQKINHEGSYFYRGLIYVLVLSIPVSYVAGNFKSHAETVGLLNSNAKDEPVDRPWFGYLANTRVENAPGLCVLFEVSESLNRDYESYFCSKWSSAQSGNLNPTSIDWGQTFLSGDRSINRLRSLKNYIEENRILVATDNISLAKNSVDPLVIVARDAAELVEIG